MRNIKIIISYAGENYHGWQKQKNGMTIQESLENAIYKITGENVTVFGCGRTDAGVHAKYYVSNFFTDSKFDATRFKYAINAYLPTDIVCLSSEEAEDTFDSRWSKDKTYTYVIKNSDLPDAFLDKRAWHIKPKLNIDAMKQAAKAFLGEHDFIGFAASGFTVKTTVRTIYSLDITENDGLIEIKVKGNGFLYNMVRIIAGTLVFCGMGKISPDNMAEIIESKDRTRAGITAPPDGLYLTEVNY